MLTTHHIGVLRRVSRLIKARLLFGSDRSPMLLSAAPQSWSLDTLDPEGSTYSKCDF